jgi:thioesterase domain-containing protein/acyl carrier protein
MVPAAYVRLEALPLTPNGKLDRKALPAPQIEAFGVRGYEAPIGNTEQILAEIWADVLKVERVGRRDNFFDLGGHSLSAVRLFARIEAEFGRRYNLSLLFRAPTVADFAKELGKIQQSESGSPNIVILQSKGSKPPIFAINTPSMFYTLSRRLGAGQPFIGLQLIDPADEKEVALNDFSDIAAEYVRLIRQMQPKGPYAIMGWCVGGALAFEAARQLSQAGEDISFVGIANGWAPGHAARLGRLRAGLANYSIRWHNTIKKLGERENSARYLGEQVLARFRRIRTTLAQPGAVSGAISYAHNPELLAEHLTQLAELHELKPFPGKVTVFRGSLVPTGLFLDAALGWSDFAREGVDVVTISGDHVSIFKDPGAARMAAHIAGVLNDVPSK